MKHIAKLLIVILALYLSAGLPALALDDTPANRAAQADAYLQVVTPQSLLHDMTEKIAATLPADQRDAFKTLMNKKIST